MDSRPFRKKSKNIPSLPLYSGVDSRVPWFSPGFLVNALLVGGFNHFEKYESQLG